MKATVMYAAGDVRVEKVPDARLVEPTDALVRVTHACICGSDLWPYKKMARSDVGSRMGHEFIGLVEAVGAEVRTVKRGDLSSPRSPGPMARVSSAGRGCRRRACTAAGGAGPSSTAARARPCGSRRPTGRWSRSRSAAIMR